MSKWIQSLAWDSTRAQALANPNRKNTTRGISDKVINQIPNA
ncbi:MAG: hypothetical protein WA323_09070 [Candidatus Nitrosopolaris sp.]